MKLTKILKGLQFFCLVILVLQLNAQVDFEKAIIFQDFPFTKLIQNNKEVILEKQYNRRSRSFSNTEDF